jgi:hypothetical protein
MLQAKLKGMRSQFDELAINTIRTLSIGPVDCA